MRQRTVNFPSAATRANSVPVAGGSLAAWNTASVGQWLELSGTQPSTVDPGTNPGGTGPAGKIDAWNSLVINTATDEIYGCAGGGHTDYAGNEAIRFRGALASPAWDVLRSPTASASIGSGAQNYYNDGRPASRHSYYGLSHDSTNNRVLLIGGSRYQDGNRLPVCDAFNLSTNDYLASGSIPDFPAGMSLEEEFAACKDTRNSNVICVGNNILARYNASSNTWTTIQNGTAPAAYGACSAFDSTRNRCFFLGGGGAQLRHTFAPDSDGSLQQVTLSGANAADVSTAGEMGMVYVPSLDVFLVRKAASGGTVYQINASTFAVTTFSTTGGASVPAVVTGPFHRFLYSPNQRGCFYVPTNAANVWFLRVH